MKTLDEILEEARISNGGKKMKSVLMIALDEDDNVIHLMHGERFYIEYSLAASADRKREIREIIDKISEILKRLEAEKKSPATFFSRAINLFKQAKSSETTRQKTKDKRL